MAANALTAALVHRVIVERCALSVAGLGDGEQALVLVCDSRAAYLVALGERYRLDTARGPAERADVGRIRRSLFSSR